MSADGCFSYKNLLTCTLLKHKFDTCCPSHGCAIPCRISIEIDECQGDHTGLEQRGICNRARTRAGQSLEIGILQKKLANSIPQSVEEFQGNLNKSQRSALPQWIALKYATRICTA